MSLAVALSLLAQVGPAVTPGAAPPLPHERQTEPLRPPPKRRETQTVQAEPMAAVTPCPQADSPEGAADAARDLLTRAKGSERASAGECLGLALSEAGQWTDAATAFRSAQAAAEIPQMKVRLGAMAGEAALNAGDPEGALVALDAARPGAESDKPTLAGIAVLRARALVALSRESEAQAPLAQAREAAPGDAQVWLLSATLSRRLSKLPEAQAQIEKAAALLPVNPEIGLEAGVIAVLSGREEAARKSWQSVIATSPQSASAVTAKGYLAQLDPQSAATPVVGR